MALCTDAAMVLYYDITGDNADHDDWHTREHLHERLSIPGFERATRWIATVGEPKYMVVYEVSGIDIAVSPDYLARLNNPTPWTSEMMPRFRNMVRGFCSVIASSGYGIGNTALSMRFTPDEGQESQLMDWLAGKVVPALASRRGIASIQLMRPAPPPPMTKEQSIRGSDNPLSWLLMATAFETEALKTAGEEYFAPQSLKEYGVSSQPIISIYSLHYTATSREVARTKLLFLDSDPN